MVEQQSKFIWSGLPDFWDRLKERDAIEGFWDALLTQASNLYVNLYQINFSNSIFKIMNNPEIRSEARTIRFDETNIATRSERLTGYPYAYLIAANTVKITYMTEKPDTLFRLNPDDVGKVYEEGIDYIIYTDENSDRIIAFVEEPPRYLHTNYLYRDERLAYRNFGVNVEFYRPDLFNSTSEYIGALQGLYSAYWTGPTMENIEFGANLMFGFPFMGPGKVIAVEKDPDTQDWRVLVDDVIGKRWIEIPRRIGPPSVMPGQVVGKFRRVSSSGIESIDYIKNLDFALASGVWPSQIYFYTFLVISFADTREAVKNAGSTERFLDLYVENLKVFMEKIKPEYVDWLLTFTAEQDDIFKDYLSYSPADEMWIQVQDNISSTVFENYANVLDDQTGTFALDDDTIGLEDHLAIEISGDIDPEILAVYPSAGPSAGGYTVYISGKWFFGTKVYFQGIEATNVNVITPQLISCTVPAGFGPATVTVETDLGTGNLPNGFTWEGAGLIENFLPNNDPDAGWPPQYPQDTMTRTLEAFEEFEEETDGWPLY